MKGSIMDIKETKELLEGIKAVAVIGTKIFADGKLTFSDLRHVAEMKNCCLTLREAIKGIEKVDDELKDLSIDEIQELIKEVILLINAIKDTVNETTVE
jgi:predicted metal-dependent hydrolase